VVTGVGLGLHLEDHWPWPFALALYTVSSNPSLQRLTGVAENTGVENVKASKMKDGNCVSGSIGSRLQGWKM